MTGHRSIFRLSRLAQAGHSQGATGFTLIELMIVVAVIAVLASIAYPSYTESVRKSRRAQVKADMVEYAAMAERFRTVNNTYLKAGGVTFALPVAQSPREAGSPARYTLALSTHTDNAFVITATAVGDQVNDRCGDLTLTNTNVKDNSVGALSECW